MLPMEGNLKDFTKSVNRVAPGHALWSLAPDYSDSTTLQEEATA